jgi:hypothetical protein
MAISDESGMGTTMLVQPSGYAGGNGFGGFGDGGWWILLLFILLGNGGWNNGGFGGGIGGGLYPWLNNSNQINDGFRDSLMNDNITSIRDGVFGLSTQLCNGFAGVNAGVANGFAQAEIAANARQMADMQQTFGLQTALSNCCCENRLGTADLKATVISENCNDRAVLSDGIRDIMAANSANTQRILDQLCQDKIDAKNDEIANLRQQIAMKDLAASQVAQNAFIQRGFTDEVDALYNRLSNCPVPSTPVYGRTPIFTCGSSPCGCAGTI